ncbi:triphosphoribosyl-dephospho-CoA synthase [Aurantimonas sp. A2-1-M11]|uniref:triphosphoribosyl-dephospho-CoA synthase n=1 Tax=Aurantimonas sp. A2-1-M11 TaxID=3113712 RepID=UPI002F951E1C
MSLSPDAVAAAFLAACRAELDAAKPGNVHRHAGGHGMTADTFEAAAAATAPWIARPDLRVGARILAATRASWDAVGLNANLGIVLLCAPLAAAAERPASGRSLRQAVTAVLATLDQQDTRDAFAAIALATPGGLGEAGEHDVRSPPTIGLVAAMCLAADRDLVARQYAGGFREIFEIGLPAIAAAQAAGQDDPETGAALAAYLAFAVAFPDSHIQRKFGLAEAESVRRRMAALADDLSRTPDRDERLAMALRLDAELKHKGRNPGTSADLTVASLFARNLAEAQRE